MKKLFLPLLALLTALSLSACGTASPAVSSSAPPASEPAVAAGGAVRVAALKGPTAMGMLKMMDDDASSRYRFTIHGTPDEITAGLTSGDIDIAAVPCNLASVLYNKTSGGVKVIAVNTRGVLYVLDTTGAVRSVEDLRGKTVYSTGMGTTPEFALNYILRKNGLEPDVDVTVEYKSESTELGTLMASGMADLCVLPEPYATTVLAKNENAKAALSLSDEWGKVQPGFGMLTGSAVVRTDFLAAHPDAVKAFLEEYRASVDYINAHAPEGAQLVEKYEIAPAAVAETAIPHCNIVYMDGTEMQTNLSGYLGVLFEADPKSVGGKLPDEAFYYQPE